MTHESAETAQLAKGVWMSISGRSIELLVPRLFADRPITLSTDEVAVCRPEQIDEPGVPGQPPLDIASLGKGRRRVNLLLVLSRPMNFPPVRPRARISPEGFLFHQARDRPHDGYYFHCPDPDRVIELLTRHGVELTQAPHAWAVARRRPAG